MSLNRLRIRLFQVLCRFLDRIWPKDRRLLIFGSRGGAYMAGNSRAMFEYIEGLDDSPFRCFFMLNQKRDDTRFLCNRRPSLRTIQTFLRAKTILVTNSLGDMGNLRPSHRKNVIHLWHGQGPKADGYATKKFTRNMLRDSEHWHGYTTAFLTCSRLDSYMRAYAHALHPTRILPLGYPRCDYLHDSKKWQKRLHTIFDDLPEYDHVVLYATTWRTYGPVRFFPFEDFSYEEVEAWCQRNRILILVRSHQGDGGEVRESEHVRNLPFAICPDIDRLLPEVDLLVNDYSSIQSDFMILDRPIIYVAYDLEEFLKRQDFCYPNYDFWCPGKKVLSFKDFRKSIEQALRGDDQYAEQRRLVNQLINEFQTPGAAARVYKYLLDLHGFDRTRSKMEMSGSASGPWQSP
jgi:CDP-glycerol glycerophosphotransferase (TagB/SpsB family)